MLLIITENNNLNNITPKRPESIIGKEWFLK